jgi:hypothetical protein
LLKILNGHGHVLPATAATLLKTPRKINVQQKSGGSYMYFGLASKLRLTLSRLSSDVLSSTDIIKLQVNVDGLPVYKSSSLSMWPILCAISNMPSTMPFPIALYSGNQKPSNLDFLTDFISEAKHLLSDGLLLGERIITISLQCFICDAPARAMIKGIVQYNGRYGCDMCEQAGEYDGRMLFLQTDARLRTDNSFRLQTNKPHHRLVSPLTELPLDMVNDYPLDYMHLVNLGVTRRLMLMWISGPRQTRLSATLLDVISHKLLRLKRHIPHDFARKPRSLESLKLWKATEFRQFLLYTGPLVLYDVLDRDLYQNFMSLSCGIAILINENLNMNYNSYAHDLLVNFVKNSIVLYGKKFVSYNVHGLTHLAQVAARFGSLDNCSAYRFENYLHVIKTLVHCSKNPIVQVANRLHESEVATVVDNNTKVKISIVSTAPNNCYILDTAKFCLCHEVLSGSSVVVCEVFVHTLPMYEKPCDSRLLGIQKLILKQSEIMKISSERIVKRGVFIPLDNRYAVGLPLLHEL